jgi:hypothetical protein
MVDHYWLGRAEGKRKAQTLTEEERLAEIEWAKAEIRARPVSDYTVTYVIGYRDGLREGKHAV